MIRSSVSIKQKDVNILKEAIKSSKEEYKNKIKEYKIEFKASEEEVVSSFLSVAIMLNEEELVKDLLADCTDYKIFQYYDSLSNNPIYRTLCCENPKILKSIQTFVNQINPTPEQITMDNIEYMHHAISISRNAGTCYHGIMKQVYTQESLNPLVDMMGGEDEIYDISY